MNIKSVVKREKEKQKKRQKTKKPIRKSGNVTYYRDGTTTGHADIKSYFKLSQSSLSVTFNEKSLRYIEEIVEQNEQEVGFMGVADTSRNRSGDIESIFIRKVYYPVHDEQHSSTCSFEEHDVINRVLQENEGEYTEDALKVVFYGHSHHNMGVNPSVQDNNKLLELAGRPSLKEPMGDVWVRSIHNKDGDIFIDVIDIKKKLYYNKIKIIRDGELYDNSDILNIKELLGASKRSPHDRILDLKQYKSNTELELKNLVEKEKKEKNAKQTSVYRSFLFGDQDSDVFEDQEFYSDIPFEEKESMSRQEENQEKNWVDFEASRACDLSDYEVIEDSIEDKINSLQSRLKNIEKELGSWINTSNTIKSTDYESKLNELEYRIYNIEDELLL